MNVQQYEHLAGERLDALREYVRAINDDITDEEIDALDLSLYDCGGCA